MDPQHLTPWQTVKALVALGRVPFAIEASLWTLLGCLLSAALSPVQEGAHAATPVARRALAELDGWTTLLCMLIVYATNVSANYQNEWADYELDRPAQVRGILRDLADREALAADESEHDAAADDRAAGHGAEGQVGHKMFGSTTRILHDGTFPPIVSLLIAGGIQLLLLLIVLRSRAVAAAGGAGTPFAGLPLQIGIACSILTYCYACPPLRLHYHGLGELVSTVLLTPAAIVFGYLGHHQAVSRPAAPITLADILPSTNNALGRHTILADGHLWTLLLAAYLFAQARILIMHLADIPQDRLGGKWTFVAQIGHRRATRLYAILNGLCVAVTAVLLANLYYAPAIAPAAKGGAGVLRWSRLTKAALPIAIAATAILATPIVRTTYAALLAHADRCEALERHASAFIARRRSGARIIDSKSVDGDLDRTALDSPPAELAARIEEVVQIERLAAADAHRSAAAEKRAVVSIDTAAKLVSVQTLATPLIWSLAIAIFA